MSRAVCYQCYRAKVACLCDRIEKQPNQIKVIVLQHPSESGNAKGTAIIAELGLQQYQRWTGEDFSQHLQLNRLLTEKTSQIAILFPADNAIELNNDVSSNALSDLKYLIVIDATWRKAKKIWQMHPLLQSVPAFCFNAEQLSNYRIRKVPQDGYLSTLESIVVALRLLENRPQAYQSLLKLFDEMIDFQIDKMGDDVYQQHYPGNC